MTEGRLSLNSDRPQPGEAATPAPRVYIQRWAVDVARAFDDWFRRTYHGEEKYVIAAWAWDAGAASRQSEVDRLLGLVRELSDFECESPSFTGDTDIPAANRRVHAPPEARRRAGAELRRQRRTEEASRIVATHPVGCSCSRCWEAW